MKGNRIGELGGTQFNFNLLNLGVFISSSLYLCSRQLLRFFSLFQDYNETEGTFQLMLIAAKILSKLISCSAKRPIEVYLSIVRLGFQD